MVPTKTYVSPSPPLDFDKVKGRQTIQTYRSGGDLFFYVCIGIRRCPTTPSPNPFANSWRRVLFDSTTSNILLIDFQITGTVRQSTKEIKNRFRSRLNSALLFFESALCSSGTPVPRWVVYRFVVLFCPFRRNRILLPLSWSVPPVSFGEWLGRRGQTVPPYEGQQPFLLEPGWMGVGCLHMTPTKIPLSGNPRSRFTLCLRNHVPVSLSGRGRTCDEFHRLWDQQRYPSHGPPIGSSIPPTPFISPHSPVLWALPICNLKMQGKVILP